MECQPLAVLDSLAYFLGIDWYEIQWDRERKVRCILTAFALHCLRATSAGMLIALTAIYGGAAVSEWFDYGGEPYHFRLEVKSGGEIDIVKLMEQVDALKRTTAVQDESYVVAPSVLRFLSKTRGYQWR